MYLIVWGNAFTRGQPRAVAVGTPYPLAPTGCGMAVSTINSSPSLKGRWPT